MRRWTLDDVVAAQVRMGMPARLREVGKAPPAPKRTKFGNSKLQYQGLTFDSKHELQCWKDFKAQELCGAIRSVIRQVSMPLPGTRRRIRVDFLVVENDGQQKWFDAKGCVTDAWALKAQQVLEAYGIKIEIIR